MNSSQIHHALAKITQPLRDIWMSYPIWFYLLNARARSLFASHPVELSPLQRSIVERLRADGIAVTSLEELAPGKLAELQAYAATLSPIEKGGKKDFILEYWDAEPTLSLSEILSLSSRSRRRCSIL